MKKPIKILLIVVLVLAAIYVGRILYGFFIFYNVSSEDQMKIAQASYERCLQEGGSEEDCNLRLAIGLKASMSTQKQESMETVLDGTKLVEERISALEMFYLLSRNENEQITKQELDFYKALTYSKDYPIELGQVAFEYLLEQTTGDKDAINMQIQIAGDPEADPEYRKKAIRALGQAGVTEAGDLLVDMLADEDPMIRWTAGNAIGKVGVSEQIPELLNIAVDNTKMPSTRENAITAIHNMFNYRGIENPIVIDTLKSLLQDEHFKVRAAAASALRSFTGDTYEIEEGTEEELENIFFGD